MILSRGDQPPRTIRLPFEFSRLRVLLEAGQRLHLEGKQTVGLGTWTAAGGAASVERVLPKEMSGSSARSYVQTPILISPGARGGG